MTDLPNLVLARVSHYTVLHVGSTFIYNVIPEIVLRISVTRTELSATTKTSSIEILRTSTLLMELVRS